MMNGEKEGREGERERKTIGGTVDRRSARAIVGIGPRQRRTETKTKEETAEIGLVAPGREARSLEVIIIAR